jgi:retinol dehydrogenase-14
MQEKIILITGGTSGIGKAAALELARRGAGVVFTYRDPAKGKITLEMIRRETGNSSVDTMELDLASLESIRRFAERFRKEYSRLDVLINNAGGYYGYRKSTEEGFEYTFGVNHLGHFVLTNLLKESLVSGKARIINVSSEAQRMGHIYFDDLMIKGRYRGFRAYCQAKLANLLFTYELAERWAGSGITANAAHPGAVRTNFGNESKPFFRILMKLGRPFLKSPARGADTIVYLATSPDVEGFSGKYYAYRRPVRSIPESYDKEIRQRLWNVSEELTGVRDQGPGAADGDRNAGAIPGGQRTSPAQSDQNPRPVHGDQAAKSDPGSKGAKSDPGAK